MFFGKQKYVNKINTKVETVKIPLSKYTKYLKTLHFNLKIKK
jgi:hypothetical protein